jgi:hypothetical protein
VNRSGGQTRCISRYAEERASTDTSKAWHAASVHLCSGGSQKREGDSTASNGARSQNKFIVRAGRTCLNGYKNPVSVLGMQTPGPTEGLIVRVPGGVPGGESGVVARHSSVDSTSRFMFVCLTPNGRNPKSHTRSAQSPRHAQSPQTHDMNAFQRALWKSRRGRPRPAPQDQARGQVPTRQPRLERIEDPVERQLRPIPPGPVPLQRQPARHQRSGSSSIGAVNLALGTVTGTTPGDGDCALHAAACIGRAQLGPEERAAANAAAGALQTALLQHAREQRGGYRQQAGSLGRGPTEWARHAAAATSRRPASRVQQGRQ